MGACGGKEEKNDRVHDEDDMSNYIKKEKDLINLLLLGAGESGKSTFAKQMRLIHMKGFSEEERLVFKSIIYDNVLCSAIALVKGAKSLEIAINDEVKKKKKS